MTPTGNMLKLFNFHSVTFDTAVTTRPTLSNLAGVSGGVCDVAPNLARNF